MTARGLIAREDMSAQRALIVAACALAGSTGCATYHARPLSPARNAEALAARSLADARLHAFIEAASTGPAAADTDVREHPPRPAGAPQAWDLTTLTLAALYFHPSLDVARAQLAVARAGVRTARRIPNPSLSFEDLSVAAASGGSAWTIAPVIDFLVETAGKRRLRTREARALADAARADLTTASWQVRGGVRDALLALWAARGRLDLLRQRLTLEDRLSMLLDHRLAAGEASALDVARERASRIQTSLAVQDAERAIEAARTQLAAAVGVPRRAIEAIPLSLAAFETARAPAAEMTSGALRRQALTARSDVRARLADYAAAEATLALEVARQYPDLTLGPGYSFDSVRNRYLLLPAAELPLFDHHQGPIAQALARRDEAAARFTALQLQILDAIDGAAAAYRTSSRAVSTADTLLASERDREQRMVRSFRAGAIDRPSLIAARLERLTAEQSRLEALLQQRQALAALEDALRHPIFGPALPASPESDPRIAAAPGSSPASSPSPAAP